MKRLLFVIPWSPFYVGLEDFNFSVMPERAPESVVALATYLMAQGAEVEISDMLSTLLKCKGDIESAMTALYRQCERFKPDIIGFSFFTARFSAAADIFYRLKNYYSAAGISAPMMIAGGVHATLLPDLTFKHIPFDALSIGEGEMSLLSLIRGEELDKIPGIIHLYSNERRRSEVVQNLDELPFADWSLIDWDFYTQPSHQISSGRLDRVMPITFGRGCMYKCNFCAHASFLEPRCHTAEYFVQMMDSYASQCKVNTFIIQDSSIGNFKGEWEKVCDILIQRGRPYKWLANLRANQVDKDFMSKLKAAGCVKLFFGFESGSPRILERMNKRITVEQSIYAAQLCHKFRIPFYASFVVNYIGEDEEDLKMTEDLIRYTQPSSLAVNKFSPIPGSKDYDKYRHLIEPHLNSIDDWTKLGCLCSDMFFGNMPEEKFHHWYNRLKKLRTTINSHEDSD